ncbi:MULTISPECIES: CRISPR-associated ring nuclease Csm6 [unclassified Agarivorans]|uniref:CRISPR-associated ring nuclease Csm6 n=1 Tax=unclassified Agarivorans TaxID=2636026 RepID=UPI003D7DA4E2
MKQELVEHKGKPKEATLLIMVGLSPQIVTETIYAHYQQKKIQFTKVIIITTPAGKQAVVDHLLDHQGGRGKLSQLVTDYSLKPIELLDKDILLIEDQYEQVIDDAQTSQQLTSVADYLLELVRGLTEDEQPTLCVSLAGGRKTMTFYLGYAVSLFARQQDSLCHVFVDSEYESSEFFYPTPYSNPIFTANGSIDAAKASVRLTNVPFIRQRDGMPKLLLQGESSFSDCIELANTINQPVMLEVDIAKLTLVCSGVDISLSKANFVFYLMMLEDMLDINEGFECPAREKPCQILAISYLQVMLKVNGLQDNQGDLHSLIASASRIEGLSSAQLNGLENGMKATFFHDRKNQISSYLFNFLPKTVAEHYDFDILSCREKDGSNKKVSKYGIKLPRESVRFII